VPILWPAAPGCHARGSGNRRSHPAVAEGAGGLTGGGAAILAASQAALLRRFGGTFVEAATDVGRSEAAVATRGRDGIELPSSTPAGDRLRVDPKAPDDLRRHEQLLAVVRTSLGISHGVGLLHQFANRPHARWKVRLHLKRFDVPVQDPSQWTRPSPFETLVDLPIPEALVQELYVEVGLSGYHISLLCGVGALSVMNRLRALGIAMRPSGRPCPWTTRTYG
jgi:hypothetical protein